VIVSRAYDQPPLRIFTMQSFGYMTEISCSEGDGDVKTCDFVKRYSCCQSLAHQDRVFLGLTESMIPASYFSTGLEALGTVRTDELQTA
jgi:hypothetical protein